MNETPLVAEESSAVDEPALDEIPTTEESPAPEEESATASTVEVPPTAGEPAAVPEETTSTPEETAPVFEAAPVTPAEPMLEVASSLEGTAIVVDESTVESDAPVAEQPVVVEETAPVASEALVVEMVATEDVHATLELAEEAFTTSEETKDGLEGSQYAEASVSLPEQHADVPFIEESLPTAPIVEEFTSVTAEQPEVLEEQPVVASQVPVSGEHSEVGEDSEPLNAPVETSSEIEETEGVEQFETVAVEEVAEQQELATTPALDVAADIERPKSPWTSSYSVITQGPGVPVEEPASTYEGDDDVVPAQAQTPEIIVDEVDTIVPETAEVSGQSQVEAVVTVHLAEELYLANWKSLTLNHLGRLLTR
ncbi:hypothetical protein DFH29DRAFT_258578 [Suillus ampliporus]|nr:hypothetical protein DFH29DRAFT_258578 [Suillus ampliporus]